jgi:hypothetical protein
MTSRRAQPAAKAEPATPKSSGTGWRSGLPPGIFLLLIIAGFYVWTATSSQYAFAWGTKKQDHYNLLAEGFLKGHLYLAQDPPKELLALKNPYDPVANANYRLHDVSLYKGHYYVYFGPVPALTVYLPWRLITGWGIPNNLAVIIYLLIGLVFSCMLLFLLLRAAGIEPSWIQKRLAIAALGLCQTAPIILRRAYMYETAVAAGFCFLVAGFYLLARYVTDERPRPWMAVLAGLFLGFTPGCRPNYVVVVVVAGAGYLIYLWRSRGLRGPELIRELYLFGVPIALCGLGLAWYNYARFGNPLNVGQTYQLVGEVADRGMMVKLSNLLPGIYRFLLQNPLWLRHFPFVELAGAGDFGSEQWAPGTEHVEPIAGFFVVSPLCILALAVPWMLWHFRSRIGPPVQFVILAMYVAAFANMVAIIMTVHRVCERYEMDFAPSLLILSLFVVLFLAALIGRELYRIAATVALGLAVGIGALLQAAISITGYENGLIERDFDTFAAMAGFFGDSQTTMHRPVYAMALVGEIVFREQPPGIREALVTTGIPRRSNCTLVEYLDGGKMRFGEYVSGPGMYFGSPVTIARNTPYRIQLTYDADHHLLLKLSDITALDLTTLYFPTSFADAAVLRNDTGMPPNIQPFSGELNAPRGLQFASAGLK